MKDVHNNIKVTSVIPPAAIISGNATKTGVVIDTKDYGSLEFAIYSGALTDGTYTPTVYEGDAANLADAAAVADADLLGTEAAATFAATDDNTVKKIGYIGNKRYVRLDVVQSGATTGGFLTAVAIQGDPKTAPVA